MTHYSANERLLQRGSSLRIGDVTDGQSHTLLYGEINRNFPPWGRPMNVRDPAIGLHKLPNAFGGPWSDGSTQFGTLDGKVHRLNPNIDPTVLEALSTPHGGETVAIP